MKSGFVNIFGKPNAGKSTILNLLMGEKLAIVTPKAQTTRHRIKGILTEPEYQIIFSDTPGIIEPRYKLHEKMMTAVKSSLEDADLALLVLDINDSWEENDELFSSLHLKVPAMVVLNKIDTANAEKVKAANEFFSDKPYSSQLIPVSAIRGESRQPLLDAILNKLPEGEAFYSGDEVSDLPTKFFVSELIREKIFSYLEQELPYHTAVIIQEFKETPAITRIRAEIVVQRETQKGIILGEGGKMIKKIGTESRKEIEQFLQQKVYLELFVKVRPKWRDNEQQLKEYGY